MKFLADLGTRLSPSYVRGRFFSVFYLHHLLENKGQDVLPMGSGQEAWRELSTRPFVFGGQEESQMAVCPGLHRIRLLQKGRARDSLPHTFPSAELLKLDPYFSHNMFDGISRTWSLDAGLNQLVSIFVSLDAHMRPLQTGRSLIS